jgi:hypothetical protein
MIYGHYMDVNTSRPDRLPKIRRVKEPTEIRYANKTLGSSISTLEQENSEFQGASSP